MEPCGQPGTDMTARAVEDAVVEERQRCARDLHDLLGLSLSAITLKSELAHRLVTADPAKARAELTDILTISRLAMADVRSVVNGFHDLSLLEECRSARALLAAAEVDVTMSLGFGELSPAVDAVLATVMREGVTNILRHSKSTVCSIEVRRVPGEVRLEMVNDGIRSARPRPASGLRNLSYRVALLGGELRAGVEGETEFRLWVSLPG